MSFNFIQLFDSLVEFCKKMFLFLESYMRENRFSRYNYIFFLKLLFLFLAGQTDRIGRQVQLYLHTPFATVINLSIIGLQGVVYNYIFCNNYIFNCRIQQSRQK